MLAGVHCTVYEVFTLTCYRSNLSEKRIMISGHFYLTGVRGPMGHRLPGPPVNLPPSVPPHLPPGNVYGQAPPDSLQYTAGAPSSTRQDGRLKHEGPQDSVRPAMVEP